MKHPGYVVRRVPRHRQAVLDALIRSTRRFPMHGLVELDVDRARSLIEGSASRVTWTGFVIATMGRAVARHPEVNARRAGKHVVFFSHVDMGATVERQAGSGVVLDVVTIRDADRKSCAEITDELHRAKLAQAPPTRRTGPTAWVLRLPGPLRRNVFRLAGTRPRASASFGPAVGVTSLGMFARDGGWAIPVPPLTLIATVGGVVERPVVRDGEIVIRPLLPLTLSFDHGVIDGAPAARFVETLRDLTETAAALETR
ncbi:MAG TPA: 2-oxo acid dehydrogenase subunit E2 [Jiangellales bacterium]|nr:2-oxo acid dehydrogenase subunit E2 [Jiangellales bacterium]